MIDLLVAAMCGAIIPALFWPRQGGHVVPDAVRLANLRAARMAALERFERERNAEYATRIVAR